MKKKRRYPTPKPRNYRPDFARYEQEKREWLDEHRGYDYDDYQQAMREIAARCKI